MINILVLPRSDYNLKYKETRDSLDEKFSEWLIFNKLNPVIISNSMSQSMKIDNFIKSLNIKGIILTGGDFKLNSKRYILQKKVLQIAKKNKSPVLGLCQGMQMMSVFFGEKLHKVKNHVSKKHTLKFDSDMKFPNKIKCFHNYSILSCPKGFHVTSKSEDGIIESIKHDNLNWQGWMWHPERDAIFNQYNNKNLKEIFYAK